MPLIQWIMQNSRMGTPGKIYYFKDTAVGAGGNGSLIDGVVQSNVATTTIATVTATSGSAFLQVYGTTDTEGGFNQPSSAPNGAGDCWRSTNPITGTFGAGRWTFSLSQTLTRGTSLTADAKINFRIWKSKLANGTIAQEVTSGAQFTNSDGVITPATVTLSLGAITFDREYLFVQIGWAAVL